MNHNSPFAFADHQQINQQRWDECVLQSPSGLIYATSLYLNHMAPGWSALIGPNYEWVMPLTHRKKFGIAYLYQPAFTQQSGVFARHPQVPIPWQQLLSFLQEKYHFWEINFNYATPINALVPPVQTTNAANYVLHLNTNYNALHGHFHKDHQRNIQRSTKFGLLYGPMQRCETAVAMYRHHYARLMPQVSADVWQQFEQLATLADKQGKVCCRQVVNTRGETVAAGLFFRDKKRLYNLMNTTTADGRKVKANHFLFHSLIQEFAGSNLLLDFEGSDLPGVKPFYEKFGAVNQPYTMLKYNNLPWPLRLLKR